MALMAVLVALSGDYGYHRDELYFAEAVKHLALGYPDQGLLTPLVAAAMEALASDSLTALRLPSALAVGAIVVLSAMMARELGGGRRGELIAALATATGVLFLQAGHTLGTTTFDLLVWAVLTWLCVRAVRTGDDRLWLVGGVALALGLLNKPLPAFLAAGLLAGVIIAGPRRLLRSRWVWVGAAVAVIGWLPWLVWQAGNGWPQFEISASIAEGGSTSSQPRWAFLPFQVLLVGPMLAPIWIAGLLRLFRDCDLRRYRFLGWAWVVLAALFILTGGKPYYLGGLLPLLTGAGAVSAERWVVRGRARARRIALGAAIGASALVCGAIGLPLLAVERLGPVVAANPDVAETIGWPAFARSVAKVRDRLPSGSSTVIFTRNYGQAGAIDRFGPSLGLPQAYSGHNGYGEWDKPPGASGPVILVGFSERRYREERFAGCVLATRIDTEPDVDNEEDGTPIWTCTGPREPWSDLWPRLRRLG